MLAPQYDAGGLTVEEMAHFDKSRYTMDTADDMPRFKGIAIHDHQKPYWVYTHCSHMLCNVYHLRKLRYCEELTEDGGSQESGRKGTTKQHKATNLPLWLHLVLLFLKNRRIPFDNNMAERIVRPAKAKLKVIGGFLRQRGSETFCILCSV
jgi:transposase